MAFGTTRNLVPTLAGISAAMCVAASAGATDVQHRFADFSKVPAAFAPKGIEAAGVKLTPVVRGETYLDSDALPQRAGSDTDAGARITPEVGFLAEARRYTFAVNLLGSYDQHFMEEDESVLEFDTNLHAAVVPWGGGRMYLDVGYLNDHIDRGDPNDLDGKEPIPQYATPVTIGYRQRGTKLGFHLGAFFTDFNHNDPPIQGQIMNR